MGRRAASSGAAACSGDAQQLEPGAASTLRSVLGGPALVAAAVGVLGVVAAFCSQAGSVRQEGSAPAQPPPLQPLSAAARPDAGSSTAAAGVVPPMPEGLQTNWECAARCAAMTDGDKAVVERTLLQAGCDPENPGDHVLCASTPEQICVGACGSGQQDMTKFLPGAFGPAGPRPAELIGKLEAAYAEYWRCADECTRDGVLVDAAAVDAEAQALGMLKRCGVVQLKGGYDAELLGRVQRAIDTIAEKKSAYNKLVDRKQLHDGRFQVYLPFRAPFAERAAIGVSDLVLRVLDGYFDGRGFGIDHVSVLTSSSPSGNQSLHPDVPYFKGLTVSVHTALVDVTTEMGPTYFCPCTGEALRREDWPGSAAIKMTILKQKALLHFKGYSHHLRRCHVPPGVGKRQWKRQACAEVGGWCRGLPGAQKLHPNGPFCRQEADTTIQGSSGATQDAPRAVEAQLARWDGLLESCGLVPRFCSGSVEGAAATIASGL
mmetsp:Transcript_166143/g.533279  ORF Transcript_166143/g.533279 Transcript_166143/m.533279 type:complete len:489 (-) Transcript_166143:123-1589(-)